MEGRENVQRRTVTHGTMETAANIQQLNRETRRIRPAFRRSTGAQALPVEVISPDQIQVLKEHIDAYETIVEQHLGIRRYLFLEQRSVTQIAKEALSDQKSRIVNTGLLSLRHYSKNQKLRENDLRFQCLLLQSSLELSEHTCERINQAIVQFVYLTPNARFNNDCDFHKALDQFDDCHQHLILTLINADSLRDNFLRLLKHRLSTPENINTNRAIFDILMIKYYLNYSDFIPDFQKHFLDQKSCELESFLDSQDFLDEDSQRLKSMCNHAFKYLSSTCKIPTLEKLTEDLYLCTTREFTYANFLHFQKPQNPKILDELFSMKRALAKEIRDCEKMERRTLPFNLILQCCSLKIAKHMNEDTVERLTSALECFVYTHYHYHNTPIPISELALFIFTECHQYFFTPFFTSKDRKYVLEKLMEYQKSRQSIPALTLNYITFVYITTFFSEELPKSLSPSQIKCLHQQHGKITDEINSRPLSYQRTEQLLSIVQMAFAYLQQKAPRERAIAFEQPEADNTKATAMMPDTSQQNTQKDRQLTLKQPEPDEITIINQIMAMSPEAFHRLTSKFFSQPYPLK